MGWICLLGQQGRFLPDVARFYIAFIGGLFYPLGAFLVLLGMFFNDEFMRRLWRQKGLMVVSGIDGSGKTTLINTMKNSSVYEKAKIILFHNYVLIHKASRKLGGPKNSEGIIRKRSLLRAYIAFIDNVILYLLYVLPQICRNQKVICDRWIWDTYAKHKALGYPVRGLFYFCLLIKPETVIILDLPGKESMKRVVDRMKTTGSPHRIGSLEEIQVERKVYSRIGQIFYQKYDTITFPMIPFAQVSCS